MRSTWEFKPGLCSKNFEDVHIKLQLWKMEQPVHNVCEYTGRTAASNRQCGLSVQHHACHVNAHGGKHKAPNTQAAKTRDSSCCFFAFGNNRGLCLYVKSWTLEETRLTRTKSFQAC